MTRAPALPEVRHATPADDAAMIGALVRAYRDDPIMNWAFRAGERRDQAWAAYFQANLDVYRPYGTVFTTAERRACAMWAPPGKWRIGFGRKLRLLPKIAIMLGLARFRRGLSVMERMEREHPREQHWYLNLLGVDPDLQACGIGSALVAAGLARADEDGSGAYLETSNPRNLSLYRRHGFEVTNTFDFGPDTPTVWLMWRAAREHAVL